MHISWLPTPAKLKEEDRRKDNNVSSHGQQHGCIIESGQQWRIIFQPVNTFRRLIYKQKTRVWCYYHEYIKWNRGSVESEEEEDSMDADVV